MKPSTRKRLGMVGEVLELIDRHEESSKVEVSVYGVHSTKLIPKVKELFKGRLHHFDDSGTDTSWIRLHNGKAKNNDYLAGDLSFTICYPREKGGDKK